MIMMLKICVGMISVVMATRVLRAVIVVHW